MARRLGPPRAMARRRRPVVVRGAPTRPCTRRRPRCSARSARRRARPSGRCAPTSSGHRARDPPSGSRRSSPRSPTCATRAGSSATLELVEAAELAVDVDARTARRDSRADASTRAARGRGSTPTSTSRPASASRAVAAPASACSRSSAMRPLMELLGSPELEYPVVHLTGTNGKTSAVRMIAALLEAAGLSTGAYTSPHLERVNERMAWNGEPIADDELDELLAAVAAVEELLPDAPSYFEILTAAALRWFADVAVDVAVVEVGLGGTWDATNVVDGRRRGGHQREHRPRRVPRPDAGGHRGGEGRHREAGRDARARRDRSRRSCRYFLAREPGSVVRSATSTSACASNRLARRRPRARPVHARTRYPRRGVPRRCTARTRPTTRAIALTAAEAFLGRAARRRRRRRRVRATCESPGRLEVVGHQPLVLLDGVKNVAGAHALRAALAEEFADAPRTLVVGLLREKEPHEMLDALGVRRRRRASCAVDRRQPARTRPRGGCRRRLRPRRRPPSASR